MNNIYLVQILTVLDEIFFVTIWIFLFVQFGLKGAVQLKTARIVLVAVTFFRLLYPSLITVAQYQIWNRNPFTRQLLNLPLGADVPVPTIFRNFYALFPLEKTYFVNYAFGRFWIGGLITLMLAGLIYVFFKLIRKVRPLAISELDIILLTIGVIMAGWPGLLIFVPLTLVFLALFSIYNKLRRSIRQTPIKWPILLAIITVLVLQKPIIEFFNLGVFSI